jgi:hypothetical protein
MPDGALLTVPRARLELAASDHRLAPEGDGSTADWFVNELAAWAGSELSVGSFVPGSLPAGARVLHPWREHGVPGDRPVRWREVADCGGFHTLRELAATRGPRGGLEVAGYGHHQGAGQLDVETARVLVELLQAATTTPDDVFFALWTGWATCRPSASPAPP